ncbi:porin [Ramlibacter tataouinensis]|uniref:porin n=1 Tax=Ramlibacter tataouinensis TaxID=94132 RepID=UPI0022F3CF17|nr:porin [Ramlibacter tataouinensis]WBY03801.1 porin [Ramlibacter tataouinensis]
MKKSLIALAVLAAAGTASAQSSVTLFGIVDATVQRVSNNGGPSVTRLTNSGYNSSRLGFRGTEDLGGGMSASFWLEVGLNNDDGTGAATNVNNQNTANATAAPRAGTQGLTFNRRSTVSLAGGWGEVRLGRDYTPQFFNLTVFDPFGTNGVGTTQTLSSIITGPTAVRASNSIGYFLPGNLGGFYGQLQYYMGENANNVANKKDGTGWGGRVGYAAGPFNVALSLSRTDYAAATVAAASAAGGLGGAAGSNVKQNNIGGQWDFGMAKLMGHYSWDSLGTTDAKGWLIGGLVPVGAGEIRASFSQYTVDNAAGADPRSRKFALGYVHNLSKRTALYTTYARVRNSNGAAAAVAGGAGAPVANGSSSGFDLGIRHSF